jgi:hypothetical protein
MSPSRRKQSNSLDFDHNDCKHLDIERYFETFNMEFRFQVFSLETYTLNVVDLTAKSAQKVIEDKLVAYIRCLIKSTVAVRSNCLNVVLAWLLTSLGSLEQMRYSSADLKIAERH